MRTEDLIVSLAQSATPVRVTQPAPVRLRRWTVVATVVATVVVVVVGPRADFPGVLGQARYLLLAAVIYLTAVLSAIAAFSLNIPGGERSSIQRLVPLTLGILWAALLVIWLREGGDAWMRVAALPIHLLCVLLIVGLGTVSGVTLTKMLARGASLHPGWTSALAWIAAASAGALATQIVCPIDDPAHHLTGHFGPFALVGLAGTLVTWRSLSRWQLQS